MDVSIQQFIDSDKLVLVDFWATWCGPCRAMMPVLEALEAEMGDRVKVVKIDVDEHLDLAVNMKVMGVPTFMLFRNGLELWREPGTFTKEQLKQVIDSWI